MRRILLAVVLTVLFLAQVSWAADKQASKPGPRDKCPVCGMFVSKYPDFLAQIVFRDGSVVFFDGAKDMFRYYMDFQKYEGKRKRADIESVYVTDYYSLTPVDGLKVFYVLGSDVYGPMGKEFIPFGKATEAGEFMKDHKGQSLLRFKDVTPSMLKGLD